MLNELLNDVEERFRQIVREEIKAALSEIKNPSLNIDFSAKPKTLGR